MADNDDLDDILDSALDDFRKVDGVHLNQRPSDPSPSQEAHLDKSNTSFSPSDKSSLGRGLGVGLPTLTPGRRKTIPAKGKDAMGAGKTSSSSRSAPFDDRTPANRGHLSNTLEELAQQTRQTLEGLNTPMDSDAMANKLVEDLVKEFQELGGSKDMPSIMDTMMRQLLSKDVLHEPMKEIGERYPNWLEANKSKLSNDDYNRYSRQYELIKQLCTVYETNPEDFTKIVDIMQHMQECGQPPSDIVQELTPGLELEPDGLPSLSELLRDGGPATGQDQNCRIM